MPPRVTRDKSKLKTEVLRAQHASAMLYEGRAAIATRDSFVPAHALAECAPVVALVEDASVRFVGFQASRTRDDSTCGHELMSAYTDALVAAYAGGLRTVVLAFDKYRFMPARKAATQAAHDASHGAGSTPAVGWAWDGHSPLITGDGPLPPYEPFMRNRAARARGIAELVELLLAGYVPPPGCRLIIDADVPRADEPLAARVQPFVLETDADGVTSQRRSRALANCIGEGDTALQFYARLLRRHGASTFDVDVDEDECRASGLPCRLHAPSGDSAAMPTSADDDDDAAEAHRACPSYRDARAHVRYAPGSVILRSCDTDIVPLALVAHASEPRDAAERDFIVFTTPAHRLGDVCVSAGTPGASSHHEICDVAALGRSIEASVQGGGRVLSARARAEALFSFAVYAIASGNDYVVRPVGTSHVLMAAGLALYLARARGASPCTCLVPACAACSPAPVRALEQYAAPNARAEPALYARLFGDDDDESATVDEPAADAACACACTRPALAGSSADAGAPGSRSLVRFDAWPPAHDGVHLDEHEFRLFLMDCYRARLGRGRAPPAATVRYATLVSLVAARTPASPMPTASELDVYTEAVGWSLRYACSNAYEGTHELPVARALDEVAPLGSSTPTVSTARVGDAAAMREAPSEERAEAPAVSGSKHQRETEPMPAPKRVRREEPAPSTPPSSPTLFLSPLIPSAAPPASSSSLSSSSSSTRSPYFSPSALVYTDAMVEAMWAQSVAADERAS